MKYSELNLKVNNEYNTCMIGDKEVAVRQYLPVSDKIDLIDIALQKAEQNGIYNDIKLDIYFNLYILYMYTNLEFTEEEKANEEELYDTLESNGVFLTIIDAIDDDEYSYLLNSLDAIKAERELFNRSAAALLQSFIQDLPANAEAASKIVDNFDKDKYKEVVEFAQYANGGRPI